MAALLLLAMIPAALAEGEIDITIKKVANDTAAHTYGAYQIFAGVSNASGSDPVDPKLQDVTWGADIGAANASAFITALKAAFTSNATIAALNTDDTAGVVAGAISTLNADPYAKDDENAKALAAFFGTYFTGDPATSASKVTGAAGADVTVKVPGQGYYFIKDLSNPDSDNGGATVGASTRFILEVVGGVTITPKADVPSVSKDVDDINDSTDDEDATSWGKTADYDIGDIIPYRVTGTLPSNYADYARYNYVFHDAMSAGLQYYKDETHPLTVVLYKDGNVAADSTVPASFTENIVDITSYFTPSLTATGGQNLDVSVKDFATTGDDKLGLKNITGITSSSKIVVYYYAQITGSAVVYGNPGNKNDAWIEFSNNPNAGGEGETGTTTKDTDVVFTYKVEVDKVDENLDALNGAAFALLKKISAPTSEQTGAAVEDLTADGVTLTEKSTVYKSGSDYYLLIKKWDTNAAGNTFSYSGIDDGVYLVSETVVPKGYNKAADVTFTVSADAEKGDTTTGYKLKDFTVTSANNVFTGSDSGAAATVTEGDNTYTINADTNGAARAAGAIKNQSGATLPETGGVGTTIFYVAGSILVLAAAILLITKRRMGAED